ncbi:Tyrosine recombinase XerD [Rhodobacteraceae bacterium SB2]|nr:Tyrosine recombinase XerD [Rhodobacteraceae bacterium SB2]
MPKAVHCTFRYRVGGRQCNMSLGAFPALKVADARRLALQHHRQVAYGIDPLEEKKQLKAMPRLETFFHAQYLLFIKLHKPSWHVDESLFRLHLAPIFGQKTFVEITPDMVIRYAAGKKASGFSAGMINQTLVLLGALFNRAHKWRLKNVPPARHLDIQYLKDPPKLNRYLSEEEHIKLFRELNRSKNHMLKFFIEFLLLTGARRNEAAQARWQDFDLENAVWAIPKTKSGQFRKLAITEAVLDLLRVVKQFHDQHSLENPCAYVFGNLKTGRPYQNLYRSWNKARCAAGLRDFRLHDLHHSFASILVNNGVSINEVQNLLGHASINTTKRYAHLAPETLRKSAQVAADVYSLAKRGAW